MVSELDFKSKLALHSMQGKHFNSQFTYCLEKHDFVTNDLKHRHIIYRWKIFFTKSINLISLSQNKALFASNLLAKFVIFVQKYVPKIQALLS